MELIFLGTGSAMVTRCYNTCFALGNGEEFLLVDAGGGNGILRQAELAKLEFSRMHDLFVTHAHTDHVLGVLWVVRVVSDLMNQERYTGDLNVWVHDQCKELLEPLCRATFGPKQARNLGTRIHFRLMEDGTEFAAAGMKITAFDIGSHKTKQFGFRAVLPGGKCLVCLGDEPCHAPCREMVRDCDWLLTEAFCCYEDRERFHPYEKFHSTVLDAARIARELNVRNLVLYHTEDKTLDTRKQRYTAEAASVYGGRIEVPDDLEILEI